MSSAEDKLNDLFRSDGRFSDLFKDKREKEGAQALQKLYRQAVAGEKKQIKRAEKAEAEVRDLEELVATIKKRAQNNIDRAFNKGVKAAGGGDKLVRIVRHPEFGTK